MNLQLGLGSVTLIDGSTSWNSVAAVAILRWNSVLDNFHLDYNTTTRSINNSDRINTMYWNSTYFGHSFGSMTLAMTSYKYTGSHLTEGDITFNSTKPWNSYRGPRRLAAGGGYLNDFRRVALHELGHVLGLDHPDLHGQSVVAQMNSIEGDLDDLASDDIAGIQALYGSPWAGAVDLGGGWKSLSWFGYFNDVGGGWIYHNEHGWMYTFGTTPASIWFWTQDLGWLWTKSTTYPYLYRNTGGAWLWYLSGSSNPRWFNNLTTGHWESH